MTMQRLLRLGALSIGLLSAGCSAATESQSPDDADGDSAESAGTLSNASTYYLVRRDTRRCAFPQCGGYWVQRVNRTTTLCGDGSPATTCYVAAIEMDRTSVDASIVRGAMTLRNYGAGRRAYVFEATEAWRAETDDEPRGSFFRVEDNGVRCVRAPCYSLTADRLNSTMTRKLTELTGACVRSATDALTQGKILVAGTLTSTAGGRHIEIAQLYTPTAPAAVSLDCASDADCTVGAYARPVASESDCYCPSCPTTVMNTDSDEALRASWSASCSSVSIRCPRVACAVPPAVACVWGQCQRSAN